MYVKIVRSRHQQSDQSGSCQNTFSSSRNTDQTTIWRCGWIHVDDGVVEVVVEEEERYKYVISDYR